VSKRINILPGQSIQDVVIMHYGSLEGLGDFIRRNKINLNINLVAGDTYIVGDAIEDRVVAFFSQAKFKPASGETQSPVPAPPQPPQPTVQVFNYFFINQNDNELEVTVKASMIGTFTSITTTLVGFNVFVNAAPVTLPILLQVNDVLKLEFNAAVADTEVIWEGYR
jgi:hypothetical protein